MKKLMAILLCAVMLLTFAACTGNDKTDLSDVTVKAAFLKGPTGVGAAYLMDRAAEGKTELKYDVALEADPSVVTAALIAGDVSVAAVPTNVAATLYNKTNGAVKIAAINTLGVLYILENGNTVTSFEDLEGRTLYATGQGSNPEYVLNYLLRGNGLTPGENVTVEYLNSDELATRMASGELDLCMLPVPAATTVLMKNAGVRTALSLTEEWQAATMESSVLTQGCVVYRSDLVSADVIKAFLRDYEASVTFMADGNNLDAAAALAVKYEIIGSEKIAALAIPDCNQVFISGSDMKPALDGYYNLLLSADPSAVGGAVPGDDFYFEG